MILLAIMLTGMLDAPAAAPPAKPATKPFVSAKYGLKVDLPAAWEVAVKEEEDRASLWR